MKLFKKLLCLTAMLSTLAGLSVAAIACADEGENSSVDVSDSVSGSDSSEENTDEKPFVYRVSVKNATGFGFAGATVKLMDGDTVVASKKTNASGNANFMAEDVAAGSYTIVVEGAPKGYELPEAMQKTSPSAGTTTEVVITPTGLLEGEAPAGTYYRLGDTMYDFTINLCDGTKYTLSEALKENELVLLNFWATWCGPCKSEFPAMHDAASAYLDKGVSVLAVSTTDTRDQVANFKKENGYTNFNMASMGANLDNMFSTASIPLSVMIDRYGVIVYYEVGSMPSASAFTVQFDKFIGEDYVPTVVGGNNQGGESGGESGATQIKPTVAAPAVSDLTSVFASESASGFKFRYQEELGLQPDDEEYDEYNWPWVISEDKSYIYASNVNINNSYAILYSTVTVKKGDVLTFDYKVGTEENADIFYVMLDGVVINKYSGYHSKNWQTSYSYVFRDYEAKEHEIAFVFLKDVDTMANGDQVQLKNLRILQESELANVTDSIDIYRDAATDKNEAGAATQYKRYITPVYNPEDEYYHVNDINGPVLYANMMTATLWNKHGLWELAYNNYVVGNGMNFRDAIEDFAWEATQITTVNGYTPVTKDLKYLLDAAVRYATFGQKWSGEYHENEWLELCIYWEHYGKADMPTDPLAGISFTAAIELTAGENGSTPNAVNVPYALNPRGFKYKFIPEKSGVYKVYSTGKENTQAFLVASDRKTHLGYFDDKMFVEDLKDEDGNDISDYNFEFYWHFEAGETYYILFTTYLDEPAKFNVFVDYLGESYTYKDNAAVGPYSANLNTFELFLPDAIEYAYSDPAEGGDGYYHHLKKDGTLGGVIYLDVGRPTAANFFGSQSIYEVTQEAIENNIAPAKRAFYVDGVDYTQQFNDLAADAVRKAGGPAAAAKNGAFIAVDQDLFELLNTITLSDKYDGIRETWLLLCYYDRTLSF